MIYSAALIEEEQEEEEKNERKKERERDPFTGLLFSYAQFTSLRILRKGLIFQSTVTILLFNNIFYFIYLFLRIVHFI